MNVRSRTYLQICLFLSIFLTGLAHAIPSVVDARDELRSAYFNVDFEHVYRLGKAYVAAYPEDDALKAWHIAGWAHYRERELAGDMIEVAEQFGIDKPDSPWSWFARSFALSFGPPGGGEHAWDIHGNNLAWKNRRILVTYIDSTEAAGLDGNDFPWFRAAMLNRAIRKEESIEYVTEQIKIVADPVELLRVTGSSGYWISRRGRITNKEHWRSISFDALKQAQEADPTRGGAFFDHGSYLVDLDRPAEGVTPLEIASDLLPHSSRLR